MAMHIPDAYTHTEGTPEPIDTKQPNFWTVTTTPGMLKVSRRILSENLFPILALEDSGKC